MEAALRRDLEAAAAVMEEQNVVVAALRRDVEVADRSQTDAVAAAEAAEAARDAEARARGAEVAALAEACYDATQVRSSLEREGCPRYLTTPSDALHSPPIPTYHSLFDRLTVGSARGRGPPGRGPAAAGGRHALRPRRRGSVRGRGRGPRAAAAGAHTAACPSVF